MSLIQPIQYVFSVHVGTALAPLPTLRLLARAVPTAPFCRPLPRGASQPALSNPKASRAAAIEIARCSLPSPPYEEAEVVLPPSRLLKNVFAVIDRADTLYCRVDCSR
jgi:hypothetical protein